MSGTSNISLRQFVHIAKQEGDGDIRLSRDENRVVNKGWWGQKLATVFTSIGDAISGLFGKDGTHSAPKDRQEQALNAFRQSLVDMYGYDIAKEALGDNDLGMHDQPERLTGAKILQVVDRARELRNEQIGAGRSMVDDMIVKRRDDYDHIIEKAQKELEGKGGLSENAKEQFMQRLQDRCLRESDLYSEGLSSWKVLDFAEEEMQTLVNELKGGLHSSRWSEEDIKNSSRQLLQGGLTEEQGQRAFDDINRAMSRLRAIGVSNLQTPDDYRKFSQAFFARELSSLMKKEDGTIDESKLKDLGKVQKELLKEGSILSKNYGESKEYDYVYYNSVGHRKTDKLDGDFTKAVIEGMVGAMSRIMGPTTDSLDTDLSKIRGQVGNDQESSNDQ
jgi:hypothetical protein